MQSFPSACIFVVDVSDPGPSFGSQSFLSVLRDQLEQLGDLLALYPQQTLLSLIQVGATTKVLRLVRISCLLRRIQPSKPVNNESPRILTLLDENFTLGLSAHWKA